MSLFYRFFGCGILLTFAALGVAAQAPRTAAEVSRQERDRNARVERDLELRMQDMRALDSYSRRQPKKTSAPVEIPQLDKKQRDRMLTLRRVDPRDIERFRLFLSKEKTGIFKLFPNFDCVTAVLISVDDKCAAVVPESSDFSFRQAAYIDNNYHDIGYYHDRLVTNSFFAQGVLVSLGDVPVESASLTTPALRYLSDVKPVERPNEGREIARKFDLGVEVDGHSYGSAAKVEDNGTYAVRVIAYRIANKLPPLSLNLTLTEMKFLSLAYDTRDDIIVVFRVVGRDELGGLTIIWKELSRSAAPKIKFSSGEVLADIR